MTFPFTDFVSVFANATNSLLRRFSGFSRRFKMPLNDVSAVVSKEIPESVIGNPSLLDTQEGVDVIFNVAGENFHAHKFVVAARFFSSSESDEEKNNQADRRNNGIKEIVIDDMDPKVFKDVLRFIYRDNLVNGDELSTSSSDSSTFDALLGKLMDAADKYELPRLRLLCESYLSKHIFVNSMETTLALADRYHAMDLKSACLKFAAENVSAVIRTEGFDNLKDNCPSLQSEILRMISDGEDSAGAGRRVRPRI